MANLRPPIEVVQGGTGNLSAIAYTPVCGGTTATGNFQSVAALGNAGDVLTSNGAGALPSFQPSGAAGGDVVGPAGATDNAIVRFDGATGKLIQDSLVTISDTGVIAAPAGALAAPTIGFGDVQTGFYSPGVNLINLSINGNNVWQGTSTFRVIAPLQFETAYYPNSYTIQTANYAVGNNDYIIYCNKAGAMTVTLQFATTDSRQLIIKDYSGAAAVNNITIDGNGRNIDGAATYVINVNYGSVTLQFNNVDNRWSVL